MAEFASKGVAGTALGLGIGSLGLNVLGGLLNAGRGLEVAGDIAVSPTGHRVTLYELQQSERIGRLETELATSNSARYTDAKCEGLGKVIFDLQREIDHMKAIYVPGQLVMPESKVVTVPAATAA